MKAIIQDTEIALEKKDGTWVPADTTDCDVTLLNENKIFIVINGKTFTANLLQINRAEKELDILLNGKKTTVKIKEPLDELLHSMGLDTLATAKVSNIKAPMPGLVLDVVVKPGDTVQKGDKVLVLEAMKMENIIKAAGEGIVARILVDKGKTVDKNQVLIEFQ